MWWMAKIGFGNETIFQQLWVMMKPVWQRYWETLWREIQTENGKYTENWIQNTEYNFQKFQNWTCVLCSTHKFPALCPVILRRSDFWVGPKSLSWHHKFRSAVVITAEHKSALHSDQTICPLRLKVRDTMRVWISTGTKKLGPLLKSCFLPTSSSSHSIPLYEVPFSEGHSILTGHLAPLLQNRSHLSPWTPMAFWYWRGQHSWFRIFTSLSAAN